MTSLISRAVAAVLLTMATCAVASPAAAQGDDADPVVARVNDQEIRMSDVNVVLLSLPAEYREIPLAQLYPAVVEQLVNQALIIKAAEQENLEADPEVQRRVAYLRGRVLQEAYLGRLIEAEITEEALRERYEDFVETVPVKDEVRARHILLRSEEEAEQVIEELEGGADFAELAEARSTGPSASSGGDLGYFTKDQMVPEFAEAAFALDPGQTSKTPVQTSFGWHVIKVEDRRPGEKPSFAESAEQLQNEMTRELVNRHVGELQSAASIERFNMDGSPMTGDAE